MVFDTGRPTGFNNWPKWDIGPDPEEAHDGGLDLKGGHPIVLGVGL